MEAELLAVKRTTDVHSSHLRALDSAVSTRSFNPTTLLAAGPPSPFSSGSSACPSPSLRYLPLTHSQTTKEFLWKIQ